MKYKIQNSRKHQTNSDPQNEVGLACIFVPKAEDRLSIHLISSCYDLGSYIVCSYVGELGL